MKGQEGVSWKAPTVVQIRDDGAWTRVAGMGIEK